MLDNTNFEPALFLALHLSHQAKALLTLPRIKQYREFKKENASQFIN